MQASIEFESYPATIVVWQDISTHDCWTNNADIDTVRRAIFCSIGWLVKENDNEYVLSSMTDGVCHGQLASIPKGCVLYKETMPWSSIKMPTLGMEFAAELNPKSYREVSIQTSRT